MDQTSLFETEAARSLLDQLLADPRLAPTETAAECTAALFLGYRAFRATQLSPQISEPSSSRSFGLHSLHASLGF
jgi:hypothetical protein